MDESSAIFRKELPERHTYFSPNVALTSARMEICPILTGLSALAGAPGLLGATFWTAF